MENRNKQASELFKVQGDWGKQSKALQEKYPSLTSEDVKFETGKEADLFKRLETRLEKNRNEVISILKTTHQACS
ncbi:hypothetical protein ED312_00940 [Sinomicrobium pectinilyticum]|uniref:General stress protein CsbD n=1 Tax=Sinomicrobium pectinilyticum TaxID=1084421 RepID=A0A3N0F5A5_SINP1|nr:hypothetical protein [Sinomicrobium pectinilyticum]RNL95197.1 hypothetical protein ED312_00940 [Sinomicrobium pectinilyticum]